VEDAPLIDPKLADAGGAAASALGDVFKEIVLAKGLLAREAARAACAVATSRYGAEAGSTLGDAFDTVGASRDFHAGKSVLSYKGAASTAAVHCVMGAASGGNTASDESACSNSASGGNNLCDGPATSGRNPSVEESSRVTSEAFSADAMPPDTADMCACPETAALVSDVDCATTLRISSVCPNG